MASLTEEVKWEDEVYQLETSDLVLGGPDGIDNVQAKQLANRTRYLKKLTEQAAEGVHSLETRTDQMAQDVRSLEKLTGQAAEGVRGTAAIATHEDLDRGIDDGSIVTPRKLAAWSVRSAPLDDVGAVNAYRAVNREPLTSETLVHGVRQRVTIAVTNTGASTYAPDDVAAKPILGKGLEPPRAATLVAGLIAEFEYIVAPSVNDGKGAWLLLNSDAGSPGVMVCSIATLPTRNVGPVLVAEAGEVWVWSASPYFTGYRAPLCGDPLFSARSSPLPHHIDAVGGTVSKTAYAGLWGWAQEMGYVVPAANWAAGPHRFVDLGGDSFRLPDLRDQFFRATGTDRDTANARALGSGQPDAIRAHQHAMPYPLWDTHSGTSGSMSGSGSSGYASQATSLAGGAETRPTNTAYAPRIHI